MRTAIAIIRIAPGNVAWYDPLTNTYLSVESLESLVYDDDDLTNIRKAIKYNKIFIKEGTLPNSSSETEDIRSVVEEEVKEAMENGMRDTIETVVDETMSETMDGVLDQKEEVMEDVIDEISNTVQTSSIKEEIIVETKSKGKKKIKKSASQDIKD